MHVLATVMGSPSHTRSLAIALAPLLAAGHRVSVACPESLSGHVKAAGNVEVHGVLPDLLAALANGDPEAITKAMAGMGDADGKVAAAPGLGRMLGSPQVLETAHAVRALAERVQPDLVLRDDTEFGSLLAAELLGLPHVSLPGGASNLLDPAVAAEALTAHWNALGKPGALPVEAVYRHGRVDYVPEEFSFAAFETGPVSRYRQPVLTRQGERLPAWVAELPRSRPFVYAALGTALPILRNMPPEFAEQLPLVCAPEKSLPAIVETLSALDCDALVVTGGLQTDGLDPAPHVRLVEHAPQPLVLEVADLFITHGGYNGIREALRAATPMVVLPGMGDQPHDGARVTELGLGVTATEQPTTGMVTSMVTQVLGDYAYTRRARMAQAATLALPELAELPADLARLL
ncbi:N-glycosyltransferase [Crossiella equi]|uniref:N-glycosyltransferase n=1 Tax=Crossiella equi TaxID=130796 RepID=A0ABS5AR31_9PSEU|nr:glycosyltransferase [Crossiella equi]MBP2479039.1 N-glycosyltransferase [Crossiella equi]